MSTDKLPQLLTAVGSWVALLLGLAYLTVFILIRAKADFAVGISFIALSLAIRAYGNTK